MTDVICGECEDPVDDGIGSHPKSRDRACVAQMEKDQRDNQEKFVKWLSKIKDV